MRASGPALVRGGVHVSTSDVSIPGTVHVIHTPVLSGRLVASVHLPQPGEYLLEVIQMYDNVTMSVPPGAPLPMPCISQKVKQPVFVGRVLVPQVGKHNQVHWIAQPPSPVWTRMQMMDIQGDMGCAPVFAHSSFDKTPAESASGLLQHHQEWLLNAYVWAAGTEAKRMYRQRIDDLCIAGGSHARDIAVDLPGSVWVGWRFPGMSPSQVEHQGSGGSEWKVFT